MVFWTLGGIDMQHYTNGRADAWAFRWMNDGQRHYVVTVWVPFLHYVENVNCVIDDFGNLVHVP